MPFLFSSNELRDSLHRLVASAPAIDIAVAWATTGPALDELCNAVRKRSIILRAIVGLDFYQTHPTALERLRAIGDVRIGTSPAGVFHPKLYLFHRRPPHVIIGSANLTTGAFSGNVECAIEKALDEEEYDHVQAFWSDLWCGSQPLTDESLDEYRERWQNRIAPQRDLFQRQRASAPSPPSEQDLDTLAEQLLSWSWPDYRSAMDEVERLRADGNLSLLSPARRSWLHTAWMAVPLTRRRLETLSRGERGTIFGVEVEEIPVEIDPGYFGNLTAAGTLKQIATGQRGASMTARQNKSLARISDVLMLLGDVPLGLPTVGRVYDALKAIDGLGIATISRLMTLRRPDSMMIVNGANGRLMAVAFKMARSRIQTRKGYLEAHERLWTSPWWRSPMPSNFAEAELWKLRAAIVDSFVYEPRTGKG